MVGTRKVVAVLPRMRDMEWWPERIVVYVEVFKYKVMEHKGCGTSLYKRV